MISMARRRAEHRAHKIGSIERDILDKLSVGDLLYSFLLSAHSTRRFYELARERASYRYRRKLAIDQLLELDYVRAAGEKLSITETGRGALGESISKAKNLLATKKWDHKWRMAAFDIPEKYAALRNRVRDILKKAGFIKLQHSVWIFPHDCEELIRLIKDESRLSKHILYGVLERIEDEERLKKLFRLS